MKDSELDPLMTLEDVCKYLSVKPKTIYRLIREGAIVASKVGRFWRFKKEEVESYLSHKQYRYGIYGLDSIYYRVEVLDKYRDDPIYYLHDEAHQGWVGLKQDYFEEKTRQSAKTPAGPDDKLFSQIRYSKIKLADGIQAIALSPRMYQKIPPAETPHWIRFAISPTSIHKPHLGGHSAPSGTVPL